MNTLSYKTVSANKKTVNKQWVVVDAQGEILGRLSTKIAMIIRGKTKPDFTPNVDCGDNVIVINATKIRLTGNKLTDKVYVRHTGYPGGQRFGTPKEMLEKKPEFVIKRAVKKMLPATRLGDAVIKNLHIFAGYKHEHDAQQPKTIDLKTVLEKNK